MYVSTNPGADASAQTGNAAQFLTFFIAGEEYGIDILDVQEIKGWSGVTRIPNTEDYVLGVINLRGTVVPIVDMRKRFGMQGVQFGPTTVVIVIKVRQNNVDRRVGLVVDAVSEVYQLGEQSVQPPPEMGSGARTDFVKGLATVEGKMVILLQVDKLVTFDLAVAAGPVDAVH
jgi:purine-binding chemotaxis protein CheW